MKRENTNISNRQPATASNGSSSLWVSALAACLGIAVGFMVYPTLENILFHVLVSWNVFPLLDASEAYYGNPNGQMALIWGLYAVLVLLYTGLFRLGIRWQKQGRSSALRVFALLALVTQSTLGILIGLMMMSNIND